MSVLWLCVLEVVRDCHGGAGNASIIHKIFFGNPLPSQGRWVPSMSPNIKPSQYFNQQLHLWPNSARYTDAGTLWSNMLKPRDFVLTMFSSILHVILDDVLYWKSCNLKQFPLVQFCNQGLWASDSERVHNTHFKFFLRFLLTMFWLWSLFCF